MAPLGYRFVVLVCVGRTHDSLSAAIFPGSIYFLARMGNQCVFNRRFSVHLVEIGLAVTLEPTKCVLCGKAALYQVNAVGFCASHKEQAIVAKKGWPIEKLKSESEFKQRGAQR
jgi:hypothetical protein